jgi:hypothetical protein
MKLWTPALIVRLGCTLAYADQRFDAHAQEELLAQIREYSMNYDKQLPNFVCRQVVHRYYDSRMSPTDSRSIDTITSTLTYIAGHEEYADVRRDGKLVPGASLEGAGGAVSRSEFGTLLKGIFRDESHNHIGLSRRTRLRGRWMLVFKYDVPRENSRYRITANKTSEYVAAYHGEVFVDEKEKMVMRIVMATYGVPRDYPLKSVETTVDYDFAKIGDQEYLLPVRAEVSSDNRRIIARNVEEFREYRRFGAQTNLTFGEEASVPLTYPETKTPAQSPE